jgi:hypothetical protein
MIPHLFRMFDIFTFPTIQLFLDTDIIHMRDFSNFIAPYMNTDAQIPHTL